MLSCVDGGSVDGSSADGDPVVVPQLRSTRLVRPFRSAGSFGTFYLLGLLPALQFSSASSRALPPASNAKCNDTGDETGDGTGDESSDETCQGRSLELLS